jgi:hypothetical protein
MRAYHLIACVLFMLVGNCQRTASAQFYPDSNAIWCITHYTLPPYDVQYQMGNDPDTLIMGQVYKRITAASNGTGQWESTDTYYVRSDPFGRGYMLLLDQMGEYLTGDLTASPGDTVHDVLVWGLGPMSVVVDSISVLTNDGVTVIRHYTNVHSNAPERSFWQAGIGTGFGPVLWQHTLSGPWPECVISGGAVQYNRYQQIGNVAGQPGGDPCCEPIALGLDGQRWFGRFAIYPNPSAGIFTTEIPISDASVPYRLTVLDALGRTVFTTNTNNRAVVTDLSGRSGLFLVLVEGGGSRWSTRLIIE